MAQKFLPESLSGALKSFVWRILGLALFIVGAGLVVALFFNNPYLDGFGASSGFGVQSFIGNIVGIVRYAVGFIPALFLFLFIARGGISLFFNWTEERAPEYNFMRAFLAICFGAAGLGAINAGGTFGGMAGAIVAADVASFAGGWTFAFGILFLLVFFWIAGALLHIGLRDLRMALGAGYSVLRWLLSALHLAKPMTRESSEEDEVEAEEEVEEKPKVKKVRTVKARAVVRKVESESDNFTDNENYELPPASLLDKGVLAKSVVTPELRRSAIALEAHIEEFGVRGKVVGIRPGPVVTVFEFEPAAGVRTAKITDIAEDLKVRMAAEKVRIAHIPRTNVIGIELPNLVRQSVPFRPLVESEKFTESPFAVPLVLGVDISGEPCYFDLTKMIHLLIAGHTGTGKSVFVQALIMSLLYKFRPEECKLIIVDPKGLDFGVFDNIAHLMCPIIKNDPVKSVNALKWAVREMDERYAKMQELGGVAKIAEYNQKIDELIEAGEQITKQVAIGTDEETGELLFETQQVPLEKMPYLVIIVDEVADLMSLARKDVEMCVQRLAAKARAAGIHLVLATQRPDTSVITGTIKANFPARISFQAFSSIDSKTSLGQTGAEQLLPFGDMLLSDNGKQAVRIHTAWVSHKDMKNTCDFIRSQAEPEYVDGVGEDSENGPAGIPAAIPGMKPSKGEKDADLYAQAVEFVVRDKKPTISYIQRRLGIGYNKAATIIERMEAEGIVSAPDMNNKRQIL